MKNISVVMVVLLSISSSSTVFAMKECGDIGVDCAKCHALTVQEANVLLKDIGGGVKTVKMALVKGLWELSLEKDGRQGLAYIDFSKKYILAGPLFRIDSIKPAAQAPAQGPQRKVDKVDITTIPLASSIVMGNPKGKKKLFVFTDPDCPFCSKQHAELKKLVELDKEIVVYVKFFPLVSMHPKAYDKSRVILEQNSPELLDKAFAKEALPEPATKAPSKGIDETMNFAQSIGIDSTPTLVLPDGRIMAGYRTADDLKGLIEGKK
jgi:thiol:disulfide interchange protein DsbC